MDFFKERISPYLTIVIVLLFTGLSIQPIKNKLINYNTSTISVESLKAAIGAGAVFETLGGYKSLASDFAWIKSYVDWTRKDAPSCLSAMELAISLDPQSVMFWKDAAAITAFDFPHWSYIAISPNARNNKIFARIKARYGREAIRLLDRGLLLHPQNFDLLTQKANIAMSNLNDFKTAEECYEPLAKKANAPIYVLRRYFSLLLKNGKFAQAIKVGEKILTEAEADSPLRPIISNQILSAKKLLEKVDPKQ